MRHRRGSLLIFALVLVAIASMVSYGLAVSVQASATSSRGLIINGLAESAARMGARHAMEVITADYLDSSTPVTSPVGRHWTTFMDHEQNNMDHWANPPPSSMLARYAVLSPAFSPEDNVPYESRLHLQYFEFAAGWENQASAYRKGDHGTWANDVPETSMLCFGAGKYIEPGFHATDAHIPANARRFSDASPAPATGFLNHPTYFDGGWRPTTDRRKARYRLRYAVNAIDLGGHLLWGRQADYSASERNEWDRRLASVHNQSFHNMLGGMGIGEWTGAPYPARPTLQTMFLGYGTPMSQWVPPYRHEVSRLIVGFAANGSPLIPGSATMPGYVGGPATGSRTNMSANNQSGPWSWSHAAILANSGGWTMTPFGRAADTAAPATSYYHSRSSTPWRVNALTAPAQTVMWMLNGYLPPQVLRTTLAYHLPYPKADIAANRERIGEPGPLPLGNAYYQAQSNRFAPPEGAPFAGYTSPDYAPAAMVPSLAVDYSGAYPDDPAYWEDYRAMEQSPADIADFAMASTRMLGTDIDVFAHHNEGDPDDDSGAWPRPGRGTWHWRNRGGGRWTSAREPIHGMFGKIVAPLSPGALRIKVGEPDHYDWWYMDTDTKEMDTGVFANAKRPFYHRDSYWLDLAHAMAGAIVAAKCTYLDQAACGATATINADLIPRPTTVRDLDILFLSILGEHFTGDAVNPGSSPVPKAGVTVTRKAQRPSYYADFNTVAMFARMGSADFNQGPTEMLAATARANIRKVRMDNAAVPNIDRKVANMELVLNDMRMSFFGANPWYSGRPAVPGKEWRPLDFDGDGWACSSSYPSTRAIGAVPRDFPGCTATDGTGDIPPGLHWSLTGYFTMEKARYWRVITRGEVWDDLLKQPRAEANFESAFVIDPEGTGTLGQTQTLYGRWLQNYYRGLQSATAP